MTPIEAYEAYKNASSTIKEVSSQLSHVDSSYIGTAGLVGLLAYLPLILYLYGLIKAYMIYSEDQKLNTQAIVILFPGLYAFLGFIIATAVLMMIPGDINELKNFFLTIDYKATISHLEQAGITLPLIPWVVILIYVLSNVLLFLSAVVPLVVFTIAILIVFIKSSLLQQASKSPAGLVVFGFITFTIAGIYIGYYQVMLDVMLFDSIPDVQHAVLGNIGESSDLLPRVLKYLMRLAFQ